MRFSVVITIYLIINAASFCVFAADKYKAKHGKWRTPEKVLWLFTFFGGAVGSFISMQLFRHKTKHMSFVIGAPILAALQFALIILIKYYI